MTGTVEDDARCKAVLDAFVDACETPWSTPVEEWAARHPEFAADIRAHDAVMRRAAEALGGAVPSRRLIEEAERRADENLGRARATGAAPE